MANPGLDPVQATEFHMADMLQRSRLLSSVDSPQHTPHPASRPIDFHVGAVSSQIGVNMSFDQSDLDHVNTVADTGDKDPYIQWAHYEHIVSTDNM